MARANIQGRSVDVLVVNIVFSGHKAFNYPNTLPLRSGSSGTDSLTTSASFVAWAMSTVVFILLMATKAFS